ncbi:MAG: N-acetylmuramic acid 6-phosphate etherase [Sciscionella sp.]
MVTVRREMVHVETPTESRNPQTVDIDQLSTVDVLCRINAEDALVAPAVAEIMPSLATVVDFAVEALRRGGRVHYVGAGTSGRLAALDAAELSPTFNVPPGWFVAHHAGGHEALLEAIEDAEDDSDAGAIEIHRAGGAGDVVIGLAASGRTPYVIGALGAARALGAYTALVSSNPQAPANADVDVPLVVDTGAEAIAGSTRMKAGTAQKMVLTAFSTAVMIRLGYTYSNLMVSMRATNAKLRGRTVRILTEATGMSQGVCADALTAADDELKVALVHLLSGVDIPDASLALTRNGGHVREALRALF